MLDRCYNPDVSNYYLYGARGINVCPEWRGIDGMRNFTVYIERELGPRPPRATLDRVKVNGNYEPGNVRWASPEVQAANQRNREFSQQDVRVWALETGLPVKRKGQMPIWAVEAYKAAHSG
jgi:hypothetical protein